MKVNKTPKEKIRNLGAGKIKLLIKDKSKNLSDLVTNSQIVLKKKKLSQFTKYQNISEFNLDSYSEESEDDTLDHLIPTKLLNLNDLVRKINTLDEILHLCNLPMNHFEPFNHADLQRLKKIKVPLTQLNQLIGMKELKQKIIYQVLYYCQDLQNIVRKDHEENGGDLMHTVIQGSPGSGKTTVARIIAQIYLNLGILKTKKFIVAKRKDLVGEFLGHTAPKTTKVLESALGGVLFIDEAYSLGNSEKQDMFSKECIDTLTQYLSEHKRDLVVIIAGYQESLAKCFFANNEGLERRFPWVYNISEYDFRELRQILIKQIQDSGWGFEHDNISHVIPFNFFQNKMDYFKFAGGDIETFLNKCKLCHSKNTFGLDLDHKSKLTPEDLICGLKLHQESKENQKLIEKFPDHYFL